MFFDEPFAPLVRQMTRVPAFAPPADLTVSEGDFVLTMDLPGVRAEDLEIEMVGGELVVRGERRRPELGDGTQWAHSERAFGRFERRIRVPDGVEAGSVTASMDHGVLSLIVPKPERLKPKAIALDGGTEQRQLETTTA